MVAWAGESQYYVEPKRLARLGYLEARKAPGRTRERTVYTLTDQGREAIRAYARTPVRFTPVKSEPLLRLLLADLARRGARRARASPRCAPTSTSSRPRLAAADARAEALPHRAALPPASRSAFLRRLLGLHRDLIDEVESELERE